jgi:excisionase family DNA binding protein
MNGVIGSKEQQHMAENGAPRTQFLTVAEVAEMLRVSRMTVYRWVHAGDMPAVRFGRSFRVPQTAVDSFMEQAAMNGGWNTEDDERPAGAVG